MTAKLLQVTFLVTKLVSLNKRNYHNLYYSKLVIYCPSPPKTESKLGYNIDMLNVFTSDNGTIHSETCYEKLTFFILFTNLLT